MIAGILDAGPRFVPRRFRRGLALLLAAAIGGPVLAPARALADEAVPARPRVEWSPDWPRFRLWEYAGTAAFGIGAWYIDAYRAPPDKPRWQGGILFDDAFRDWLRSDTRAARERAGTVSDWLWIGGSAMPFAVDLPVALLVHRQVQVTWQLAMMDLEAFAVAGFLNRAIMFSVGRARPSAPSCAVDSSYDALCGAPSNNASFPSGHTLGMATGAGLTCVHHRYLPLYGNVIADDAACAVMVLATGVNAVARIMSDRHYATDDLAGAAIGFASGYGLPWLLHYRTRRTSDQTRAGWEPPILVPFAGTTTLGIGVLGLL